MAVICEKPKGSCATCEYFKYDEDYGEKGCFAGAMGLTVVKDDTTAKEEDTMAADTEEISDDTIKALPSLTEADMTRSNNNIAAILGKYAKSVPESDLAYMAKTTSYDYFMIGILWSDAYIAGTKESGDKGSIIGFRLYDTRLDMTADYTFESVVQRIKEKTVVIRNLDIFNQDSLRTFKVINTGNEQKGKRRTKVTEDSEETENVKVTNEEYEIYDRGIKVNYITETLEKAEEPNTTTEVKHRKKAEYLLCTQGRFEDYTKLDKNGQPISDYRPVTMVGHLTVGTVGLFIFVDYQGISHIFNERYNLLAPPIAAGTTTGSGNDVNNDYIKFGTAATINGRIAEDNGFMHSWLLYNGISNCYMAIPYDAFMYANTGNRNVCDIIGYLPVNIAIEYKRHRSMYSDIETCTQIGNFQVPNRQTFVVSEVSKCSSAKFFAIPCKLSANIQNIAPNDLNKALEKYKSVPIKQLFPECITPENAKKEASLYSNHYSFITNTSTLKPTLKTFGSKVQSATKLGANQQRFILIDPQVVHRMSTVNLDATDFIPVPKTIILKNYGMARGTNDGQKGKFVPTYVNIDVGAYSYSGNMQLSATRGGNLFMLNVLEKLVRQNIYSVSSSHQDVFHNKTDVYDRTVALADTTEYVIPIKVNSIRKEIDNALWATMTTAPTLSALPVGLYSEINSTIEYLINTVKSTVSRAVDIVDDLDKQLRNALSLPYVPLCFWLRYLNYKSDTKDAVVSLQSLKDATEISTNDVKAEIKALFKQMQPIIETGLQYVLCSDDNHRYNYSACSIPPFSVYSEHIARDLNTGEAVKSVTQDIDTTMEQVAFMFKNNITVEGITKGLFLYQGENVVLGTQGGTKDASQKEYMPRAFLQRNSGGGSAIDSYSVAYRDDIENGYRLTVKLQTVSPTAYLCSDPNVYPYRYLELTGKKEFVYPSEFEGQKYMRVCNIGKTKVISIGECAFKDCVSLLDITLPMTVKYIEAYAFDSCLKLTTIELPEGLLEIGIGAFKNCSNIESIIIPSTVTKIHAYAFENCNSLREIQFRNPQTKVDINAFNGCSENIRRQSNNYIG